MANVRIYDNGPDGLWLSRRVQLDERVRGQAVYRLRPGELGGMSWAELRRLPLGTEFEIEVPQPVIDWRSMAVEPPLPPRIVRAIVPASERKEPAREPARHVDAPAPQPKPESPPEPSPKELAAEGERLAKQRLRAYLLQRGITSR